MAQKTQESVTHLFYTFPFANRKLEYMVTLQQTFTCSKSTAEKLEKGVKYVQS